MIKIFVYPILMALWAGILYCSLKIFDPLRSDFWYYLSVTSIYGSIAFGILHWISVIKFKASGRPESAAKLMSFSFAVFVTTPYLGWLFVICYDALKYYCYYLFSS